MDKQEFDRGACRHMKSRVRELAAAGATVWLSSGYDHVAVFGQGGRGLRGHQHIKAFVFDHRVAYVSTANFTKSARTNRELAFRLTGPVVQQVEAAVVAARVGALAV